MPAYAAHHAAVQLRVNTIILAITHSEDGSSDIILAAFTVFYLALAKVSLLNLYTCFKCFACFWLLDL